MAKLKDELKKRDPFDSVTQEAMLSVLRTSDLLENRTARLLRCYDLTLAQYNVLRILRGENAPLATLEVASRMIQVAPAITRLVENLRTRDLLTKTQCQRDGRIHHLAITAAGRSLLRKIDAPILRLHDELMAGVPPNQLKALTATLAEIRAAILAADD